MTRRHEFTLTRKEIFITFGFKVVMGCIYGFIFLHFYNGDDTWAIHLESLKEWKLLQNNPGQFFREYTPETALRNAEKSGNFLSLYLADLEYCLLVKTVALFNIISRGNYYVNVVFFNFIVFWGHYWLYQQVVRELPNNRKLFLLVIFFLPTALFWLSGIRGDGLLFFFFSLSVFSFSRWLRNSSIFDALSTVAGIAGLMIFRSGVALLLIPGLISWALVVRRSKKVAIAFISLYAIFLLLFFASSFFPNYNAVRVVTEKQAQFFELHGNTRYTLTRLEPTVSGFVRTLPEAFFNTFFRPMVWEAKGPLQLVASFGILLFWMVAIIAVIRRSKSQTTNISHTPLLAVFLIFGILNYLLIGFTVPFPGAIVRYKAIAELCLFTCFVIITAVNRPHIIKNNI